MIGYIYLITDTTNGKQYVGQHHYDKEELDPNYHGSGNIVRRIFEKRPSTIKEEYLKTCNTQRELDEWEKYFIFLYDTMSPKGYNLQKGGRGGTPSENTRKRMSEAHKGRTSPNKGKPMSEETRKKLSEALRGRRCGKENPFFGKYHSEESRRKMSEAQIGKHLSDETKKKLSESRKGKHLTDETIKKLSEAHKGRTPPNKGKHISEETRKKISEARKGRGRRCGKENPFFGKHHSEESRRKMSEAHKRRWNKQKTQQDECVPLW